MGVPREFSEDYDAFILAPCYVSPNCAIRKWINALFRHFAVELLEILKRHEQTIYELRADNFQLCKLTLAINPHQLRQLQPMPWMRALRAALDTRSIAQESMSGVQRNEPHTWRHCRVGSNDDRRVISPDAKSSRFRYPSTFNHLKP
jgi:hypothetical protein